MIFFDSVGIKRYISAAISAVIPLLQGVPILGGVVSVLVPMASIFGGAGLIHATAGGTLTQNQLAGIASLFALLVTIAHFVPALEPYQAILEQLAALFGAAGVGTLTGKNVVENTVDETQQD